MQEIDSVDVKSLIDPSISLLQELNRIQARIHLFPFLFFLSGLCLFGLWHANIPLWEYSVFFVLVIPMLLYAHYMDITNGTINLDYKLEDKNKDQFIALQEGFKKLLECSRVWHIPASDRITDWKRNAGAGSVIARQQVHAQFSNPSKVTSNLKVPMLNAGRQNLYFFPDNILIYEKEGVAAISYNKLKVNSSQTRFVETESIPRDAQVIDKTWKYINKSGGPDRRFNGNRQIPVTLYEEVHFTSDAGLNELFQCSQLDGAKAFIVALEKMRK